MTNNDLKNFLKERPALSKRMIAAESGISLTLLNYILEGKRGFTLETQEKIWPVLKKYGYSVV